MPHGIKNPMLFKNTSPLPELAIKGNPDFEIWEIFFGGIQSFRLWNPDSWALESRMQLKESGVPLTIGLWIPSSIDKESGIPYLESKTVLDSLTWGDLCVNKSIAHSLFFGQTACVREESS